MGNIKLDEGQFIQISADSSAEGNFYESKLLSINKNFLEISMPVQDGNSVSMSTGFGLNLKTKTSQGTDYEFASEIIGMNTTKKSMFIRVPADLLKEIEAKIEAKGDKSSSCKLVTVISGKGGTGKTNFIVNYSLALANKGKRVALVDADLGMANIDIFFKLTPEYNLTDVIRGEKAVEEIILDTPGGVKLVPGGSGLQELATLNPYQLERIFLGFEYLKDNFDYVLIDTSSGISNNITDFVFASHETIIVTTPEPHAISDAFSILRVLISKHKDLNLKLLVNKCESEEEGETVIKRISGVVNNIPNCRFTPIGFIPENKIVSKCIKNQTPLYLTYPDSDVSTYIESMADDELGLPKKVYVNPAPVSNSSAAADNNSVSDNNTNNANLNKIAPGTANLVKKFKGLFAKN
jgi:flagellar biosynthesis protein FlhG